jgi:plasmid maintenance system antidote protein VapI
MYPNLKWQIWRLGVRQNRLAQMVGIHETLLSKIVNGFREPDSECRVRIAQALQTDEEWLFANNVPAMEHQYRFAPDQKQNPRKGTKKAGTERQRS